jgi:hypothetical protein
MQLAIGLGYSVLGAAVAFLYGIAAYCAGSLVCAPDTTDSDGLSAPTRIAVGAAIFASLFSVLAVLGLANKWIVIAIPAAVLATAAVGYVQTKQYTHRNPSSLSRAVRSSLWGSAWNSQRLCHAALWIVIRAPRKIPLAKSPRI